MAGLSESEAEQLEKVIIIVYNHINKRMHNRANNLDAATFYAEQSLKSAKQFQSNFQKYLKIPDGTLTPEQERVMGEAYISISETEKNFEIFKTKFNAAFKSSRIKKQESLILRIRSMMSKIDNILFFKKSATLVAWTSESIEELVSHEKQISSELKKLNLLLEPIATYVVDPGYYEK